MHWTTGGPPALHPEDSHGWLSSRTPLLKLVGRRALVQCTSDVNGTRVAKARNSRKIESSVLSVSELFICMVIRTLLSVLGWVRTILQTGPCGLQLEEAHWRRP